MATDRRQRRRSPPRLLAVTDLSGLDRDPVLWARQLDELGVDGLWLREKGLDARRLYELGRRLREVFRGRLVISARVDLALAVEADGVQLPSDGVPLAPLRRRLEDRLLLGRSTHAPEEVTAARLAGADWVTFSPIFDTPSKRGLLEPVGLDGLRRATALGVPVLALGGVSASTVPALLAAGAWGVAGIRCFRDPAEAATLVEAILDSA